MFSVKEPQQGRGITSFKHAVNRTMAIIRDGNWRTPLGFHNHCEEGRKKKESIIAREKKWEIEKNQDCNADASAFSLRFNTSIQSQYDQELKIICDKVKKLDNYSGKLKQQSVICYQDSLLDKIKILIEKGADKNLIRNSGLLDKKTKSQNL